MADVLHKSTLEFRQSVSAPDYDPAVWLIFDNGESGRVPTEDERRIISDVPRVYWKLSKDTLAEMSPQEKAAVDAAEATRLADSDAAKTDLDGAKSVARQIVQSDATIIASIDTATLAQARAAIKTLAQNQQILAKGVLRLIEGRGI